MKDLFKKMETNKTNFLRRPQTVRNRDC